MEVYDQLWSLIEAEDPGGALGLISNRAFTLPADDTPTADLQVDLSALESSADQGWTEIAVLAGPVSSADDFFPIHAPTGADSLASGLPGFVPSTGETPLVLPATPDVVEAPEPLVLPGLMADEFVIPREQGGPRLWVEAPHGLQLVDPADNLPDWSTPDSLYGQGVDHTLPLGDHGLIGAHGTDDWLL